MILNIERGNHRLMIDEKDGFYRVCCNGGVYATFSSDTDEIGALQDALLFAAKVEEKCLKYPKEKP